MKNTNPKSSKNPTSSLGFWLQSSWPQYRKIVNGKEECLDGTETADTEIVKYDYSDDYRKYLGAMPIAAKKKMADKKP